jgi:Protein of unknown function (DUF5656)
MRAISRRSSRTGLAYVAVRAVVYLAALAPIVLIYSTKERALVVAPPIGLICAAATWFLLADTPANGERRVLLAAGVGIVVAELAWGLGYWAVVPLVGGAALWLAFYVLSGIVEHGAGQTLDRRIVLEYGFVALVGVLVVMVTAPWRAQVG